MTRRGVTLIELLVAMTLGVLVLALCAGALIGQRRAERRSAESTRPGSAADEAVRVVASSLARLAQTDTLWARGDTALEWRTAVGVAVTCAAAGDTIVVPDSGTGAWWEDGPDSGDVVEITDENGRWTDRDVVAVTARSNGACAGAQRTLRLSDSIAHVGAGFARVTRRVRFMLYRGGDGLWWLGQRTCTSRSPALCGAAQPVAGPLLPPPLGARFTIDSAGLRHLVSVAMQARGAVRTAVVAIRP